MFQSIPGSLSAISEANSSAVAILLGVVERLVSRPDQVATSVLVEGSTRVLVLRVARMDVDCILGKNGRTARSLKVLLNATATSPNDCMELEIQGSDQVGP